MPCGNGQASQASADTLRLPILEMFKTNVKITVDYHSFAQYQRTFFAIAHNADILPDSGTGFPNAPYGPDYAQINI